MISPLTGHHARSRNSHQPKSELPKLELILMMAIAASKAAASSSHHKKLLASRNLHASRAPIV
jgi:hypothetical protein